MRTPKKNNPPIQQPDTTWHEVFLRGLALCPVVSFAARFAKVSRRSAYEHREAFPEFATAWEEALAEGIEIMEAEAVKRAKKTSDVLMIFLLKAHKPEKYRETLDVNLKRVSDADLIASVTDSLARDGAAGAEASE